MRVAHLQTFLTFLFMISFASVNAVLFTPALPAIATFFTVTIETAQLTLVWFLIGYTIGQLLYGPLASRYGRRKALYIGILMQIIASLGCVMAGLIHTFSLLIVSRFFVALGAGVGLKMTFTLVNEMYTPKQASQKMAYLMLAFAITPGLSVVVGGLLTDHFGWMSCFIVGALYGLGLFAMITKLPIPHSAHDLNALKWSHLCKAYSTQFKNKQLLAGSLLMGSSTTFIYAFAALAPFIAMNSMGMNSTEYGMANLIPSVGLAIGALLCAYLIKKSTLNTLIKLGVTLSIVGALFMLIAFQFTENAWIAIFLPMWVINVGLALILPNASSLALSVVHDKAHGSALMNFINMGLATTVLLALGRFSVSTIMLPSLYLALCIFMFFMLKNMPTEPTSLNHKNQIKQ